MIEFDTSEVRKLAADLGRIPPAALPAFRAVVQRGALNLKNGWRDNARQTAGRHARRYPDSITYETDIRPTGVHAVIGPDKNRPQGALGNLLEFGSSKNPPHHDGQRAADVEFPRTQAYLTEVAEKLVQG